MKTPQLPKFRISRRRLRFAVTLAQGYFAILLLAIGSALMLGLGAGMVAAGIALLGDLWRPWEVFRTPIPERAGATSE